MPYRLNPKNKKQVQVKKRGLWMTLKTHRTIKDAQKHLTALRSNVRHRSLGG